MWDRIAHRAYPPDHSRYPDHPQRCRAIFVVGSVEAPAGLLSIQAYYSGVRCGMESFV